jgi:AcrR family transcriptional regulator
MGPMAASRTPSRRSSPDAAAAVEPRERILAAASRLFTQQGIGRTGVDSLIATAGVAKATFYRHFPAKEDLVLAWLRDPRTRWFDRVRMVAEADSVTPAERISNLFKAVASWLELGDYRGCPYLNSAVELADPDRPPARAIREYLAEIRAYLEEQVRLAGSHDVMGIALALQTLLAGAISLGVADRTSVPALVASEAAVLLLR